MKSTHPIDRLVAFSLSGGLPLFIFCFSILLGLFALHFTAREEEPQIVVPMVDITVFAPGLSARQVERQVTIPMEKLLAQIPGVENVYSSSRPGQTNVTLRFYVGENRENAILNTYNKLLSNRDKVPKVVSDWIVKPVEVDDVPILLLGIWSDDPRVASDYELRRIADEVATSLQAIQNTSQVNVTGGRPRMVRILLKPESLSARQSSSVDIVHALQVTNLLQRVGNWSLKNESIVLESGNFLDISELKQTVVNVVDGIPVLLQDVAEIVDGPDEATSYTWIDFSARHPKFKNTDSYPMVTISVAKQRGSNAVSVAKDVHRTINELHESLFPSGVHVEVIRDYGETANDKVNNLTSSLVFAVLTVIVFVAIFLGWRPAIVVGLAVPISYGITLALDMAFGYTINRVTLFALILSLGLLVDDPITGVDNIERFYREKTGTAQAKIMAAISELKVPLIMSTITIILAFIPLAFITGMMGPYMAPMAFNVPVAVMVSTVVAFVVTPWLAKKILKNEEIKEPNPDNALLGFYRRVLEYFLESPKKSKALLVLMLGLFVITAMLPVLRLVPIKLLPYDNKNVLQVVIDLPESATLEMTASVAKRVSNIILQLNEVQSVSSYVGEPSPIDFNGMVRQYYQRNSQNLADLRILLVDRELRQHHSHGIALRLQKLLKPLIKDDVVIKIVETPAGPPVMSTLVAEVYGTKLTPYSSLRQSAKLLKNRLEEEAFVTEVDVSIESEHKRLRFMIDKQKAALSGISTDDVNQTLLIANSGYEVGFIQLEREARPLPLTVRLPLAERASMTGLHSLQIKGREGITKNNSTQGLEDAPLPLVSLGELGEFVALSGEKTIYHKDLRPVVYVTAEISGRTPAEVIADMHSDFGLLVDNPDTSSNKASNDKNKESIPWDERTFINPGGGNVWSLPSDISVVWNGEGEWKITIDVFRDMGLAFIFALIGIFVVLNFQTSSATLSLIIMSAIPLTIIGIMPGFFLLNQIGEREIAGIPDPTLFTATAMIGMIALAGIVVRNSLILVEFIEQLRGEGLPIKEALIQAGAIRMRPILLTAGTTLLGNLVITLDPVFSGLAIAIIFGIVASTLFTLLVVPVVYLLVFQTKPVNLDNKV